MEFETIEEENAYLREQNDLKDQEIAFLRERLENLRGVYEEMQVQVAAMKPPMLSPTRKVPVPVKQMSPQLSASFPGQIRLEERDREQQAEKKDEKKDGEKEDKKHHHRLFGKKKKP